MLNHFYDIAAWELNPFKVFSAFQPTIPVLLEMRTNRAHFLGPLAVGAKPNLKPLQNYPLNLLFILKIFEIFWGFDHKQPLFYEIYSLISVLFYAFETNVKHFVN